jgi:DNA polymerase (family 10)
MPVKIGNVIPGTLEANKKVAEHLILISYGLSLDNQTFKVRAFENAAESVQLHPEDVSTVADLKTVGKIGDSTAAVIREFCATGTSQRLKDLAAKHPMEAFTMCVVDGIGPKTALKLHAAGTKNFDALVADARAGKLDAKLTDAVLFAVGKTRVPHGEAKALANAVIDAMRPAAQKCFPEGVQFEVCGSIRRKAVDSKDVDIVCVAKSPESRATLINEFVKLGTMIKSGEDRASIRFSHNGRTMQVDLWVVPPESFGAAICYATGSKAHNIELRAMASKRGLLINEFGIYEVATNKKLGGHYEQDIYRILEISYVEPHERG